MKVKCIHNTGAALREYEYKSMEKNMMGRFGATGYSEYNELEIGKEYLVMGIIIFKTYQAYLIDDNGLISACPCQLFEVTDSKVPSNWYFRLIEAEEDIYPFVQSIFGYYELCVDKKSYENLIVEKDEDAMRTYFRRKMALERS
ncbi:hypothetical protein [Chitinophaga vietnamensis]|uniref:hypothetical protein n=1 Tax=Chitinophaga vietnamensis TaxID=2593957 RepID=UPI0011778B78|nr:hypothetical protein [Chitinophaga vietnamensis]